MIFVTVGTHEQQFNRLVKKIDEMKKIGKIKEEVFIQTGYSTFEPKHCQYEKLIKYNKMLELTNEASIVITHGGPGSIMLPLSSGKTPIVVPRMKMFHEHVDNHQVKFTKRLESEQKIFAVYDDINIIENLIINYNELINDTSKYNHNANSNLKNFVFKLDKITDELLSNQNKVGRRRKL